jgi:hypothetical protein
MAFTMAQDSTLEGIRRALFDAEFIMKETGERAGATPTDLVNAMPLVVMKQQLALNRIVDLVENLESQLRMLQSPQ